MRAVRGTFALYAEKGHAMAMNTSDEIASLLENLPVDATQTLKTRSIARERLLLLGYERNQHCCYDDMKL